MELLLTPRKVVCLFGATVLLLTLAHLGTLFSIYVLGYDNIFGMIHMFSLNAEENIPALYSTVSLLFCSVLLALISYGTKQAGGKYFFRWAGLAGVFLFLAMDESLSFHESTTVPLRKLLNTGGILFYAWVIPYALALLVLFFAYLRFLLHLEKRTRNWFLLAGAIYISGAMLVEVLGGLYDGYFGRENAVYALISTVEELLEMGGILVFIYSLTSYISVEFPRLRIGFSVREEPVPAGSAVAANLKSKA